MPGVRFFAVRAPESASGRRALARVAFACVLVLPLPGCQTPEEVHFVKVEAEVVEAVRQARPTPVIVSLTPPRGYGEAGADIAVMKPAIARLQDDLLTALGPADYQVRTRFDAVPALALTILNERALAVLERHSGVIAVRLDLGGVG